VINALWPTDNNDDFPASSMLLAMLKEAQCEFIFLFTSSWLYMYMYCSVAQLYQLCLQTASCKHSVSPFFFDYSGSSRRLTLVT